MKLACPSEESLEDEQWVRVARMLTAWSLNSVAKDIVEAFLYTSTVKELWDELEEKFGGN